MQTTQLRLVTLNSWKGEGRYKRRLALMAEGLKHLQPDIVCLQEALRTADLGIDTAGYLGRELGLAVTYGQGRYKTRTIEGQRLPCYSGLAILSRYTPSQYRLVQLPSCDLDPDRTVLSAVLGWDGQALAVSTVHLTHVPGENTLRERQLQSTLAAAHAFFSRPENGEKSGLDPGLLSFCCGDLNWNLNAATLNRLQSTTGFILQDCYLEGGGELPGYTFGLKDGSPVRIDYILRHMAQEDPPIRYRNARVVLTEKDVEGLMPSDHFGVMVDIDLQTKS